MTEEHSEKQAFGAGMKRMIHVVAWAVLLTLFCGAAILLFRLFLADSGA